MMKKSIQITLCASILLLVACAQEAKVDNKKQQNTEQTAINKAVEHAVVDQKNQINDQKQANYISVSLAEKKYLKSRARKVKVEAGQVMRLSAMADIREPTGHYSRYPTPYHSNLPSSVDSEKYQQIIENSVKIVKKLPVSTFSIDVDTASYANIRRILNQGNLPQYDAVRVEEFINYFSYDYPQVTTNAQQPFSVYTEVAPSPFNDDKHLIHIGIKGKTIDKTQRPAANLVFLIDVSGSMNNVNKLGLLKNSLKMLVKQLDERDRIAIVVYAGAAGTVLKPTAGDNRHIITNALASLSAGGSTNGGAGIQAAYRLAEQSFVEGGINRVILATDGDFNVGTVNQQALKNLIEQKRQSGIALSVLGFGMGNYNDALMQQLAQNGNGNAYYIDTLNEARKVLVEELSSTLITIANDVKIQLEFNPKVVSEYRLIGYETRALNREDFNNDKVDAGEIGAGHTVTALYEVSFVDAKNKLIDDLRYQDAKKEQNSQHINKDKNSELAYLRLRYKLQGQDKSQLIETPILRGSTKPNLAASSNTFRFSAAVAGFGQLLRGGKNLTTMTIEQVINLAQQAKGADKYGYRAEFINIVKLSDALAVNNLIKKPSKNIALTEFKTNLLKTDLLKEIR
jgi:Ca-activated chloride channel family protein